MGADPLQLLPYATAFQSREDLVQRIKGHRRGGNVFYALWMAWFLGMLLAAVPLARRIELMGAPAQHVYGIGMFAVIFGSSIPVLVIYGRWRIRRFRLLCPGCKNPVVGSRGQVAVATGRCGECGTVLFPE